MLRYFTSLFVIWGASGFLLSQSKPIDLQPKDTTVYNQPYGIRVGIDLSRPLVSFLQDNYTGFEIVGDYRLGQKLYLAAELGNEKKNIVEELGGEMVPNNGQLYDFTVSGSYIKLGVDLNTYDNWYGMNNSIFAGGRLAFASFNQTVNNFRYYNSNRYWSPNEFALGSDQEQEFSGLSATWLEFVFGTKVELFANIYLGASVRLGFLLSNSEPDPDEFKNLFIPGFNKVTEGSNFGVGYNFSISYLIPLYKKTKKSREDESTPAEIEQQ
ncbi:MAG: DUF6048 family protein [Bacteroidota bacterium]